MSPNRPIIASHIDVFFFNHSSLIKVPFTGFPYQKNIQWCNFQVPSLKFMIILLLINIIIFPLIYTRSLLHTGGGRLRALVRASDGQARDDFLLSDAPCT